MRENSLHDWIRGDVVMIETTTDSISVCTSLRFEECLRSLRRKLEKEQLRVVWQLDLRREFQRTLGLHWRKQVVLIIWNSFYAYQGLLAGEVAGVLLPFSISISDHVSSVLITTSNHSRSVNAQGAIGTGILKRELSRKMEQILMEFAVDETTREHSHIEGIEAINMIAFIPVARLHVPIPARSGM